MLGKIGTASVLVILSAVLLNYLQPNLINQLWIRLQGKVTAKDQGKFILPKGEKLFTREELSLYTGVKKGPYLAIMGKVYDVSVGMQHYGPDGGYSQFAGKDASRSFVTGDFSAEGLNDDVSDFSPQQMLAIDNWMKFYEKDYNYVGRLIGRFYDEEGRPTEVLHKAMIVLKAGKKQADVEAEERKIFPSCNSEWSDGKGGRLWCSPKSGGIERDWTGVPRQLFNPSTGQTKCVCAHPSQLGNPNLREYSNCASTSVECALQE